VTAMTDIAATLAAIAILRDLDRWSAVHPSVQRILCRAWMRLESEAYEYLTGSKQGA